MLLAVYVQDLNPLGNRLLSTLVAALPVLVLFYLLVGRRWLASWAGAAGAVVAILLAWLVYKMPLDMAGWSFVHGAVVRPAAHRLDRVRRDAALQRDGRDRAVHDHPPVDRRAQRRRPRAGGAHRVLLRGVHGRGGRGRVAGRHLRGDARRPRRAAVPRRGHLPDREHVAGVLRRARRADPHARSVQRHLRRHDQHHVRAPAPVPVVPHPAVHGQDDVHVAADARRLAGAGGRRRVVRRCSSSSSPPPTPTGSRRSGRSPTSAARSSRWSRWRCS